MKRIYILLAFALFGFVQESWSQHQIIPVPVSYESTEGTLSINQDVNLVLLTENDTVKQQADMLAS